MAASIEGFVTRYPAFAGLDSGLLAAVLGEAQAQVDDGWIASDIDPATYAFMAHVLALDGHGGTSVTVAGSALSVVGPAQSVQVGDAKVSFSDKSRLGMSVDAGRMSALYETSFGRRFLELRRRSFPDVITV